MAVDYTATINGTDYGFDFVDQEIEIEAGVETVVADDLKDAIREAEDSFPGMAFDDIMSEKGDPVPLDPLSGTATDRSVVLLEAWRILSLSLSGSFTLTGGNIVNSSTGVDVFAANTLITYVNNASQAGTRISVGTGLSGEQDTKLTRIHALLDAIEGTFDHAEIMRILLSAAAGKASGAQTTNIKFRDNADSKDRIDATVDEHGNRSSVTLDAS